MRSKGLSRRYGTENFCALSGLPEALDLIWRHTKTDLDTEQALITTGLASGNNRRSQHPSGLMGGQMTKEGGSQGMPARRSRRGTLSTERARPIVNSLDKARCFCGTKLTHPAATR